jgi:RNA polymerase sigma-70 factor (ECF subfamily)
MSVWRTARSFFLIFRQILPARLSYHRDRIVHPDRTDAAEIESLYRQHGAALLLFAAAITGERSRAQDALHHVFLKLIEDGNLRQALDKKAYLFACVRNAILNDAKVRNRHTRLDPDSVRFDSAWFTPPERDYAAEHNLRRALTILPGDQRAVIVLHIWGELTFAQIADLLEISANTAASRYRYALAKLRETMLPAQKDKESPCANSRG